MSLRIPLTRDQTLQTEFHEIERRLRRLERSTGISVGRTVVQNVSTGNGSGNAPPVDLTAIYERLTILEDIVNNLPDSGYNEFGPVGQASAKGLVPAPGVLTPPTGLAAHILQEDATWGFPFRGLIQVTSAGDATTPGNETLNVLGSLGINGDLSARDFSARAVQTLDGVTLEGDSYQLRSELRGLVGVATVVDQVLQPTDTVYALGGLHVSGDMSVSDIECYNLRIHGDIEFNDSFWDDLRIEPVARTTGANAPTFEKWYDDTPGSSRGVYLYSFDDAAAGSEKEVFFTMQMPHAWKLGTPVHLHVHWVGAASDTAADPRWGLEYTWKDIGEVYGDTTIIYSDGTHYSGLTTDPDVTAGKHYLTEFSDLVPGTAADGVSSIIIARLFRDSANGADTYNVSGAKCGLLYIDAHYEIDSIGSSSEYIK